MPAEVENIEWNITLGDDEKINQRSKACNSMTYGYFSKT